MYQTTTSRMTVTTMISDYELAVDIETYSGTGIDAGVYRYVEDPDFEIVLIGYKYGDGPVKSFMPRCFSERPGVLDSPPVDDDGQITFAGSSAQFETTGDEEEFLALLRNPKVLKSAYNANFERTCLAKYYGIACPPDEWRCTMILASSVGLPRSLDGAGAAMGLPEDQQKLKTGKALIQYFCKPCKGTKSNLGRTRNYPRHDPDKWKLFIEYNLQDVVTEQAILEKLKKYRPLPAEQKLWSVDQDICDRGIRVDRNMAEKITTYEVTRQADLMQEARQLTGLQNPNSVAQLKDWFSRKGCFDLSMDCSKAAVAEALKQNYPEDVHRVLEIRQSLGKTSTKKYDAMLGSICRDDRVRGMLQFYGANRTGRWAGRIVQLQNLPQNHIEDLDDARQLVKSGDFETLELMYGDPAQVFSELVRTAFIPSEGNRFIVTDFSAIEARVIAWLAGEDWRLDVFRKGGDIYCASAEKMYHVPVVKHGVNGHLRQRGKVAELALGYGGGVRAMKNMDTTHTIPEEEMQGIVDQWRAGSPEIVAMWKKSERAAIKAIEEHTDISLALRTYSQNYDVYHAGRLVGTSNSVSEAKAISNVRYAVLGKTPDDGAWSATPSCKTLETAVQKSVIFRYDSESGILFVRLPSGRSIAYWGARVVDGEYGKEMRYYGVNQTTRAWELLKTYGGKLVENIVQATARDCLAAKMMKAEEMGYKVVAHVHDEMILDVPKDDKDAFQKIDDLMKEPIDWAPGLPLKGGTYECPYYQKD